MSDFDPDELTERELRTLADTPVARLAMSCRDLVGTSGRLKAHDAVWDQMMRETESRASRINSVDTAENVVEAFLETIDTFGTLAEPETETDDTH